MANIRALLYVLILLPLIAGGCRSRSSIVNLQSQWSSLDPRSIPLNIREKEFNKGNLVSNPSFELGRNYYVDTVKLSFNLPGWKKVGEEVYWTDIQNTSAFQEGEASSGIHAVKIERDKANETDIQGEGIISDYIRVIPGNYRLSMDIRLKHVESQLERLGANLYDAVNIRLYFYDKNKVLIRDEVYHPAYDHLIDNSFKGQPFSGFPYINEFDWGRLIARSGNFPFDEGNLPDEARYVRIFAGLKGTGVMWIDMVDFRYSSENFTFLEKTEPLFDSTMERSEYLIPRPKKSDFYKKLDLIQLNDDKKELKPLILVPASSGNEFKGMINSFVKYLRAKKLYTKNENPVITRITTRMLESGRLVFSFGNTSLASQFSDQLPSDEIINIPQAYYTQRLNSMNNVVFIGMNDDEGLFHAIHTIEQLMDIPNLVYHHYDITDYPDCPERGMILPVGDQSTVSIPADSDIDFLLGSGINRFILEARGEQLGYDNIYSQSLSELRRLQSVKSGHDFLSLGVSLRELRYALPPVASESGGTLKTEKYLDVIQAEADRTVRLLNRFAGEGLDEVILSDQALWNSMGYGPLQKSMKMLRDKPFDTFIHMRNAYWTQINENKSRDTSLRTWLYPLFSDIRMRSQIDPGEFCYERSLNKFSSLFDGQLWTGPVKYSTIVDDADFARFSQNIYLKLKLLDNTLAFHKEDMVMGGYSSRYPGKVTTGVLFEPYQADIVPGLIDGNESKCLLNVLNADDLTIIRLATAADFLWNHSGYDPWLSAWKALVTRYGKDTAIELIYFNDLYYSLLSVCQRIENSGYNPKLIKTGEDIVIKLDAHWENIKTMLENKVAFLNDLSDLKNRVLYRFSQDRKLPEKLPR